MRQTLFYIPHELGGTPLFGFGWLLLIWSVFGLGLITWLSVRRGVGEALRMFPFLLAVAAAVTYVMPLLEVRHLGLPIRGYGMMLLLAVVSGVSAAVHRGRQVGIHPDQIYSLAFWLFVSGILGARLFWVAEYWSSLPTDSLLTTVAAILRFTEGGLVVYGSLIGASLAFAGFSIWKRIPPLPLADAIAPSLVLGLAIGRLGCLLNGCCFGGVCEDGQFGITFPQYSAPENRTLSPVYHAQLSHQLTRGHLHGIQISSREPELLEVTHVQPGSLADSSGITEGIAIASLQGKPVTDVAQASYLLGIAVREIEMVSASGQSFLWAANPLPARSQPVHPTQLYSTINGLLIFGVAWTFFPFRRRAGEACGLVLTIYPVTRFLLEWVRVDEAGRFGTQFTISQWISLAILLCMVVYWPLVLRQPRITASGAAIA